ncbi:unnamed protein product [Ectocarpus sp. CCAP 1310/34]|nr:unnamed protein product [Ectocarpus sp. CCAP 1310/34]
MGRGPGHARSGHGREQAYVVYYAHNDGGYNEDYGDYDDGYYYYDGYYYDDGYHDAGIGVTTGVESAASASSLLSVESSGGPPGSERWVAESGASNTFTNSSLHMYDLQEIPASRKYVVVVDGRLLEVQAIGSINLSFFQEDENGEKTMMCVKLTDVSVVESLSFNLFSTNAVSLKQ